MKTREADDPYNLKYDPPYPIAERPALYDAAFIAKLRPNDFVAFSGNDDVDVDDDRPMIAWGG